MLEENLLGRWFGLRRPILERWNPVTQRAELDFWAGGLRGPTSLTWAEKCFSKDGPKLGAKRNRIASVAFSAHTAPCVSHPTVESFLQGFVCNSFFFHGCPCKLYDVNYQIFLWYIIPVSKKTKKKKRKWKENKGKKKRKSLKGKKENVGVEAKKNVGVNEQVQYNTSSLNRYRKPKSEVPWRLDVRNILNHNKMRKKHLSVKPPPFNNRYDLWLQSYKD